MFLKSLFYYKLSHLGEPLGFLSSVWRLRSETEGNYSSILISSCSFFSLLTMDWYRFLIICSVLLPPNFLATFAHLDPYWSTRLTRRVSSSLVHPSLSSSGLRWLIHISLQALKFLKNLPSESLKSSKEMDFHSCLLVSSRCLSTIFWSSFFSLRSQILWRSSKKRHKDSYSSLREEHETKILLSVWKSF